MQYGKNKSELESELIGIYELCYIYFPSDEINKIIFLFEINAWDFYKLQSTTEDISTSAKKEREFGLWI